MKIEENLCLCGCEEGVKSGNKFIHGHHSRGRKFSEETRRKLSIIHSGKTLSEETRTKLSIANSGKTFSEEHKANLSVAQIGRHHSEKTKAKISAAKSGHFVSEETRRKISIGNTGKTLSEETKVKLSIVHSGEKCNWWQGGIAFGFYGPGNNEELKEKIRVRDDHTCQECGVVWVEGEERFSPHHIDYDKSNHTPWNRITLCHSCHSKTNSNRDYWMNHLYEINFNNCIQRVLNK